MSPGMLTQSRYRTLGLHHGLPLRILTRRQGPSGSQPDDGIEVSNLDGAFIQKNDTLPKMVFNY
jgi:hypothetical protein